MEDPGISTLLANQNKGSSFEQHHRNNRRARGKLDNVNGVNKRGHIVGQSHHHAYPPRNRDNKLFSMTIDFVHTYKKCNSAFKTVEVLPQRILTNPAEGVLNNGWDNEESNLICRVHDKITHNGVNFTILDLLGTGTFGQVLRCQRDDTKEIVAVKIIKNKPAYHTQGILEHKIVTLLNNQYDRINERHIVRLLESFLFKGHICLVFELLSISLLDVLTQNQFRGLPLAVVQRFTKQILMALVTLEEANVIHCDLKPENILLVPANYLHSVPKSDSPTNINDQSNSVDQDPNKRNDNKEKESEMTSKSIPPMEEMDSLPPTDTTNPLQNETSRIARDPSHENRKSAILSDIKVIDFGSACFEGRTIYSYIQSRFYRSPEVLLGIPYNGAIDMWSLACVCAEMYLGLPLFPGLSQHNQLSRIVEMLGNPPDFLIEGKNGSKFFNLQESKPSDGVSSKSNDNGLSNSLLQGHSKPSEIPKAEALESAREATSSFPFHIKSSRYRIKTAEEYALDNNTEVPVLRKYLRYNRLDEVIMKCPLPSKAKMSSERKNFEMLQRQCFLDFLMGLFRLNPFDRWTARQAAQHPFITKEPFVEPFHPPVDLKANERKLNFMLHNQKIRKPRSGSDNFLIPSATIPPPLVPIALSSQIKMKQVDSDELHEVDTHAPFDAAKLPYTLSSTNISIGKVPPTNFIGHANLTAIGNEDSNKLGQFNTSRGLNHNFVPLKYSHRRLSDPIETKSKISQPLTSNKLNSSNTQVLPPPEHDLTKAVTSIPAISKDNETLNKQGDGLHPKLKRGEPVHLREESTNNHGPESEINQIKSLAINNTMVIESEMNVVQPSQVVNEPSKPAKQDHTLSQHDQYHNNRYIYSNKHDQNTLPYDNSSTHPSKFTRDGQPYEANRALQPMNQGQTQYFIQQGVANGLGPPPNMVNINGYGPVQHPPHMLDMGYGSYQHINDGMGNLYVYPNTMNGHDNMMNMNYNSSNNMQSVFNHQQQQQTQQQQPPSYGYMVGTNQMVNAVELQQHNANNLYSTSYAAASSSAGAFGGGSVQTYNNFAITDFASALMRPDIDEQRQLMSFNQSSSYSVNNSKHVAASLHSSMIRNSLNQQVPHVTRSYGGMDVIPSSMFNNNQSMQANHMYASISMYDQSIPPPPQLIPPTYNAGKSHSNYDYQEQSSSGISDEMYQNRSNNSSYREVGIALHRNAMSNGKANQKSRSHSISQLDNTTLSKDHQHGRMDPNVTERNDMNPSQNNNNGHRNHNNNNNTNRNQKSVNARLQPSIKASPSSVKFVDNSFHSNHSNSGSTSLQNGINIPVSSVSNKGNEHRSPKDEMKVRSQSHDMSVSVSSQGIQITKKKFKADDTPIVSSIPHTNMMSTTNGSDNMKKPGSVNTTISNDVPVMNGVKVHETDRGQYQPSKRVVTKADMPMTSQKEEISMDLQSNSQAGVGDINGENASADWDPFFASIDLEHQTTSTTVKNECPEDT